MVTERELFEYLRQTSDPTAFVASTVRLGKYRGFCFAAEDVVRALESPEPRSHSLEAVDVGNLEGWTPVRLFWEQFRGTLEWCRLGVSGYLDPFFDRTVEKALQNPAVRVFRRHTSIDILTGLSTSRPGPAPSGFIFHMSRCGSTLVSQILATLPETIVVSEAEIIDAVLRADRRVPGITDEQRRSWLRGIIAALIPWQEDTPTASSVKPPRHLFIKFDSWHVMSLALIRRTFPAVPWIFVYRHPLEVVASHARQGKAPIAAEAATRRARILARFCESALEHLDETGRLVEFHQLPDAIWTGVLNHFGVPCSAADVGRMKAIAEFDAKRPSLRFHDDSQDKRNETSADTRAAVERWALPAYDALQRRRLERTITVS